MTDWIRHLFTAPDLARMGHGQDAATADLGLGWLYYALARAIRARAAAVIGSYRGFVPLVVGKALADAGGGAVTFIDPSLVDDFWTDADAVRAHFAHFGVTNVTHHRATTQQFVETAAYAALGAVDYLFVDGFHSAEQARFDYEAFAPKLTPGAVVLFHDSVRERSSGIYGQDKRYDHTVCQYMAELRRDPRLELVNFPEAGGVTLVRLAQGSPAGWPTGRGGPS